MMGGKKGGSNSNSGKASPKSGATHRPGGGERAGQSRGHEPSGTGAPRNPPRHSPIGKPKSQ